MKDNKLLIIFFLITGIFGYSQVTVNRIGADMVSGFPSYTFTSGDVIYNTAGGNLPNRNSSNICSGAVYRIQLSTVILELKSSATNSIVVHGQSSGSSIRNLTSIETSSTLSGTYTTLAGVTSSSTINSSSVCGTMPISNISIPANTFVRLTFSGNINLSGFDITQFNPIVQPTVQASSINFSNVTNNATTVNWVNGNGSNRVVFVKEGSQGEITNPSDGVAYSANTNWNSGSPSGTQLGTSGYFCVYNGSGTSVNLTNLNPFTDYWVQIFEYNGSGVTSDYLLTTASNNPNSFASLANPIATSVSGIFNIGETLTGAYAYESFPGEAEGVSLYQWFRATTADGIGATPLIEATDLTYLLTTSDEGHYVRFTVVPVDENGLEGSLSVSPWYLVNSTTCGF
jgi:hypothetical protein